MMICQKCRKQPATLHLTDLETGVPERLHLCESCAEASEELYTDEWRPPSLEEREAYKATRERFYKEHPNPGPTCPVCGRNRAVVHITAAEHGRQVQLHTCRECVERQGPGLLQDFREVEALRPPKSRSDWGITFLIGAFLTFAGYAFLIELLPPSPVSVFAIPILAFTLAKLVTPIFRLGRSHASTRTAS